TMCSHPVFAQDWIHRSPLNFRAIALLDEQVGVMVGQWGLIDRTNDQGLTWTRSYQHTGYLHGVHFVDDRHGWAVGFSGAILHSDDGGVTWSVQQSGISA